MAHQEEAHQEEPVVEVRCMRCGWEGRWSEVEPVTVHEDYGDVCCYRCPHYEEGEVPGCALLDFATEGMAASGFCAWGGEAMTSATERLRALLDERGVEHVDAEDGHTQHTWWSDGDHEIAASNSGERLAVYNLTPEQAIDATLGRGTCRDLAETPDYRYKTQFECSECGYEYSSVGGFGCDYGDEPDFRYCPNCGRRVVE